MRYNLHDLQNMFPGDWDHDSVVAEEDLRDLKIRDYLYEFNRARRSEVYWVYTENNFNAINYEITYDPEYAIYTSEWSGCIAGNTRIEFASVAEVQKFYKKHWGLKNFK